jgi:peptidoglycan/LPS O-acetylase OafA/YrhL
MAAPQTAHSAYLQTRHFGSLDGVRCLSILAVIWHHVPHQTEGRPMFQRGFLGVDMFFVLSGFLIVTLLLRERDRTGGISLRNFYARRTLRIFPIYYLLIFGVLLAYLVTSRQSQNAQLYFASLPAMLTYTCNWIVIAAPNMGGLWSLATEEQFYLAWPTIEKYLRPWLVWVVLALVLLINQFINFGLADGLIARAYGASPDAEPAILQTTFTPIALGVLLAHALHRRRSFAGVFRLVGWRAAPIVLFALLLMELEFAPVDISGLPRLVMQSTFALLLASLVVREDHLARPVLDFWPVRRLGIVSYGMYLYHMWVIHVVRVGFDKVGVTDSLVFYLVAIAATAIVSEISFRFIESPLLLLKSRFAR